MAFNQHRALVDPLSQPSTSVRAGSNVTAGHVGKHKSNHNLSGTVTHRGHSPKAIVFIAQFQSFVRISTVIYQSDRN